VQPLQPNRCGSLDFMGDTLSNRRAYRTLNVIDDCARDALAIEIDFSLTGLRVVRVLERLCEWHGVPPIIRSDNGPEFTGVDVQNGARAKGIQWQFTQPGCPAQNATIERFNGTYRVEVLDAYPFTTLDEARRVTQDWMRSYNEERTHRAIGHLPPMAFKHKRQPLQQRLSFRWVSVKGD
jgi:putative transposase